MDQKIYHYPVWIRIWHIVNALLCLALIISGINMQYSNTYNNLFSFNNAVSIHNISIALSEKGRKVDEINCPHSILFRIIYDKIVNMYSTKLIVKLSAYVLKHLLRW